MSDEGSSDGGEQDGEVQEVNLDDADVSARDLAEVAAHGLSGPPPPPLPPTPSWIPPASAPLSLPAQPPPKPRTWVYGVAIVVVALVGAGFVAVFLRRRAPAAPKASVITIPTVEMNDEPEALPKAGRPPEGQRTDAGP